MSGRWREIVTATVVSVAATASLAVVVGADPMPASTPSVPAATSETAPAAIRASTALPPVTQHAVDPALLAAASTAGAGQQSTIQTVSLTVTGGSLELAAGGAVVSLASVPGSDTWSGLMPPVRVIDARGSHLGWTVRWSVTAIETAGGSVGHVPFSKLTVEPGDAVVIAGTPDGVTSGVRAAATPRPHNLFQATPGSGGGTYETGGRLSLKLPPSADITGVTVRLKFALA